MRKIHFLTIIAVLGITAPAFSQDQDSIMVKKISEEILLRGTAYGNLYTLCKSVGQRLSGSAGMFKGEEWGLNTLKEAGAEKAYLQECMVPHWVRGAKEFAGFINGAAYSGRLAAKKIINS